MRKGLLGSVSILLTGTGLAFGQGGSPASLGRPVAATAPATLGRPVAAVSVSDRLSGPHGPVVAASLTAPSPIIRAQRSELAPVPRVWRAESPPTGSSPPPGLPCGEPDIVCEPQCCICPPCPCDCTRFWASAEYLLWWIKNTQLPPIYSTGDPNFAPIGALLSPGSSTLFGG